MNTPAGMVSNTSYDYASQPNKSFFSVNINVYSVKFHYIDPWINILFYNKEAVNTKVCPIHLSASLLLSFRTKAKEDKIEGSW